MIQIKTLFFLWFDLFFFFSFSKEVEKLKTRSEVFIMGTTLESVASKTGRSRNSSSTHISKFWSWSSQALECIQYPNVDGITVLKLNDKCAIGSPRASQLPCWSMTQSVLRLIQQFPSSSCSSVQAGQKIICWSWQGILVLKTGHCFPKEHLAASVPWWRATRRFCSLGQLGSRRASMAQRTGMMEWWGTDITFPVSPTSGGRHSRGFYWLSATFEEQHYEPY